MTIEHWRPTIGDPSFLGWFTVFAYFATALLCAFTARQVRVAIPVDQQGRQRLAWAAMTLFCVALGFNKQLDLQSLFTAIGRAVARQQGWYGDRRSVQFLFIIAMMTAGGVTMATACWAIRRKWREYGLMLVGFIFAVSFIIIRAASFHHFEQLGFPVGRVKLHRVLELCAIALMAIAALRRLWDIQSLRHTTTNQSEEEGCCTGLPAKHR